MTSDIDARNLLWVAVGVAVGALGRWAADAVFVELVALVVVNGAGCAVMGVVGSERGERLTRLVGTGFCGGLTTMSSAAVAVGRELSERQWLTGLGTLVLLVAVSAAGFGVGRRLRVLV